MSALHVPLPFHEHKKYHTLFANSNSRAEDSHCHVHRNESVYAITNKLYITMICIIGSTGGISC